MSQPCGLSSCTNPAPYTCPRCSLPYCSVSCYNAHSQPCLDAFAEQSIHPLRGLAISSAHRRSFNDMLERIRNQTDYLDSGYESDDVCEPAHVQHVHHDETNFKSDTSGELHVLEQLLHSLDEPGRHALFTALNSAMEKASRRHPLPPPPSSEPTSPRNLHSCEERSNPVDEPMGLTETLEMLVEEMESTHLGYNDIFSHLPDSLRRDFENRLREGTLDHFVMPWSPWWQRTEPTTENNLGEAQQPAPLPRLPLSSQLVVPIHIPRQKASLCLRYSLIDILAAYALSTRLCNGEWWGDAFAAKSVWQTSAVLSRDARYTSVNDVCRAVVKNFVQEENHTLVMQVLRDVGDILSGGGDWVARAVYECQRVLEEGLQAAGSGKSEIRNRIRKIGFFVAWSMGQETEVFVHLARKVISFTELESGLAEEVKIAARVGEALRTPSITILE